jgi:hypothetical protein
MKKILLYIPVVLSLLVLGAHFMRYGNNAGVAIAAALIGLLFLRRPWVARLMQLVLVLGALEWLLTLYGLIELRAAMNQPYARMTIILGTVALFTLCSGLVFQTKSLKTVYRLDSAD